jgi:hypothetical protein
MPLTTCDLHSVALGLRLIANVHIALDEFDDKLSIFVIHIRRRGSRRNNEAVSIGTVTDGLHGMSALDFQRLECPLTTIHTTEIEYLNGIVQ